MSDPLALPGLAWPVEVRTHPRARRLRLALDEPRGLLRLTVPRRVSRSAALDELSWLPTTCAYRLRYEGKSLFNWHYLISGSRETVHEAGQSTRGWTISEVDAGELEYHLVDRDL